jgi:hypothetical protein
MQEPIIAAGDTINDQPITVVTAADNFAAVKEDILRRATESEACSAGKRAAQATSDSAELLAVIKEHIVWLIARKVIDATWLETCFTSAQLHAQHIYTSGVHEIVLRDASNASITALGTSTANVKAWGTSTANVEALDTSTANVKAWGTSTANVEALGTSTANVKAWGTSTANVEAWGTSTANVEALDTSTANVKALDTSTANVKAWGTSTANVEALDTSTANCWNYNGKLAHSFGDGRCPVVKDMEGKKIFVKVSDFEIVQVN